MLPTPAHYLRTLRILHLALCGGVTVFAAVVMFLKHYGIVEPVLQEQETILLPIAAGLMMSGIAASLFFFRRKLEAVRDASVLEQKLRAYRNAQVIRWALAEAPALFGVSLLLLTSSPAFVVFALAPLVYLAGCPPPGTVDKACDTMNIAQDERLRWERSA